MTTPPLLDSLVASSFARLRRNWVGLLLVASYCCVAAFHLGWNVYTNRMPTFDQSAHMLKGIHYAEAIASGKFLHELWSVPAAYPPLYQLMLGLAALLFGATPALGLYVNLLVLAVLMAATYSIGVQISGRWAGSVAAILVVLYPGTALYTREALQELTLAGATAVSLALLISDGRFQRGRSAISFGLSLGVGLLVKPSFFFFLWLPLAIAATISFRGASRVTFRNIALVGLVALAVASVWYVPQGEGVLALMRVNRSDALRWGHTADPGRGFLSLWHSGAVAMTTVLGQYVALAAMVVAAVTCFRRVWMLHASIFGGWLVLVFAIVSRDEKYLLPMLAPTAVLVALLIERAKPPWIRNSSIALLLGVHVLAFFNATVGWHPFTTFGLLDVDSIYVGTAGAEPSLPELVAFMHDTSRDDATVAVVPNVLRLNCNTLAWQAGRIGSSMTFDHISYSGYYSEEGAILHASTCDWVLLKTGYQGFKTSADLADVLSDRVRSSPERFDLVKTFPLEDGSEAQLYRVVPAPIESAPPEQISALVERSDPALCNLDFGGRFRLLGVLIEPDSAGAMLRMAWEALRPTIRDRLVAVHLVDSQRRILQGADYRQDPRGARVPSGMRWIDEVVLSKSALSGAAAVGLALYHPTQPHLRISGGPRDWDGHRLIIPLPPFLKEQAGGPR
jgi:hypothetical protein